MTGTRDPNRIKHEFRIKLEVPVQTLLEYLSNDHQFFRNELHENYHEHRKE